MTSFQVNTTSSAVNGAPSLHFKFFRSLNVHVFWSRPTDHDSANPGFASWDSISTSTNGLNISRTTASEAESDSNTGLNVRGFPGIPRMSRPPGIPGSQSTTRGGSGNESAAVDCGFCPQL